MTTQQEQKYYIKSKFYGFRETTFENTLDWVKFKFKSLYPGENKTQKLLDYINTQIKGYQFKIEELR